MTQLQIYRYLVLDRHNRVIAEGEKALKPSERRSFEQNLLRNHARQGGHDAIVR